jgi:hypothetical protein
MTTGPGALEAAEQGLSNGGRGGQNSNDFFSATDGVGRELLFGMASPTGCPEKIRLAH